MTFKSTSIGVLKLSFKILICTMLIVCAVLLAKSGYEFGIALFSNEGFADEPGSDITVVIPEGSSKKEVAKILYDNSVIEDKTIFYIQELLYGEHYGKYKTGEVIINNSLSGEEIIELLYNYSDNSNGE